MRLSIGLGMRLSIGLGMRLWKESSAHMSPQNTCTHKLTGVYMEVRHYTLVHSFRCFKLFPIYRVYGVKIGSLCIPLRYMTFEQN